MVGENTSYSTTSTQKRGQTRKQTGRVSIRQDLPTTCRHPPAPQDSPSHPTQREEEVKRGEKERKRKTGHRCEACRTQPHGRDEETIERRYSDGGDWLWCKWTRLEGQIPPPPPHTAVSVTSRARPECLLEFPRRKMSFQFPSSESRASTHIRVSAISWFTL